MVLVESLKLFGIKAFSQARIFCKGNNTFYKYGTLNSILPLLFWRFSYHKSVQNIILINSSTNRRYHTRRNKSDKIPQIKLSPLSEGIYRNRNRTHLPRCPLVYPSETPNTVFYTNLFSLIPSTSSSSAEFSHQPSHKISRNATKNRFIKNIRSAILNILSQKIQQPLYGIHLKRPSFWPSTLETVPRGTIDNVSS